MTTSLHAVPDLDEDLNSAVARRIRGRFAELRLSASEVGRRIGLTQAAMSRRTLGKTEFTLNELQRLCNVTGIDLGYLITGRDSGTTPPDDGIDGPEVRHQGLEPRTRWLGIAVPDDGRNIVPLRLRPRAPEIIPDVLPDAA